MPSPVQVDLKVAMEKQFAIQQAGLMVRVQELEEKLGRWEVASPPRTSRPSSPNKK